MHPELLVRKRMMLLTLVLLVLFGLVLLRVGRLTTVQSEELTVGMATMDKEQVTYVDLSEGDKIELTQSSPKQTIFDRIQLAISNVKEYMGKD